MKYTANELISAVKRNASIPTSQKKFTDADYLNFLNEELQITIVGELLKLREDYFITTVNTSLIASTSEYDIPTTAIGWALDDIGYTDSNSNYTSLPRLNRSQKDMYSYLQTSSNPYGVYIQGNSVITVPNVGTSASGSLTFSYVRIQNTLVKTSSTGLISTVTDTGSNYQIVVDAVPVSNGDEIDIISGTNPFNILARAKTATVAGTTITVTNTSFERTPVAGDYIAAKGNTPYPNIPEDYHPILAQATVLRVLEALGDTKNLQAANITYARFLQKLKERSGSRVKNSPRKIVSRNYLLNSMRRSY